MAEIPTIAQYDGKRAKVRCSLQWVISYAYSSQTEPKLPYNDVEYVFESDGGLKKNVAILLCSGDPYCRIARDIFGVKEHIRSHEDVIQILCRKGLYVLDRADSLITANDLRKMPLALTCHMTIIDMLMYAAVSCKLAPMNSIISTVKKFAPFSASKDLPDDVAEALLLWLNKVSQKVQCLQRNAMESDKHTFGQQKEEESEFPAAQNLTDDMFDGRSLALLLHYYCPNHILLQDIALKDTISQADAWHNIETSLRFCNEVLLPRCFPPQRNVISPSILHPVDLLYCGPDLRINMIAFFGTLFYYLETEPMAGVVCPLGHVVAATRQPHPSTIYTDRQNSEATSARRPQTLEERHQQTLCQVNELIPGIRPLISEATKQSFNKPDVTSSYASSATPEESGNYSTPSLWSKPVHVRREKKVHSTQPMSSARPQEHYETFPTIHDDQNHGGLTVHTSAHHPFPKPQHRPDYRNGQDLSATAPVPVTNKWQARMLQDTRNTNTSNNIYGPVHGAAPHMYKGGYQQRHEPSSASMSNSMSVPTLLSNVDMSDPEVEHLYRSKNTPSSVNLDWPGFEHIGRGEDARLANMMNDMRIETARTEDQSSRSSQSHSDIHSLVGQSRYDGYSGISDPAYDGTSTFSNSTSSNEVASTYTSEGSSGNSMRAQRPSPRRYPDAVADEYSPEKPIPKEQSDSGLSDSTSSYITRPSQQSYTVQSRGFRNVDSARAAGYPIIDGSPDRFQPPEDLALSYASTSRSMNRRFQASSLSQNGSGDFSAPVANGQATPDEQKTMTIGNTVVRLRNPNVRRSRGERAAKTTSWIELAQLQKKTEEEAKVKKQRPRSVIISPKRRALIEEAKRQAAEKRNAMEDTLEKEKRKQEREWAKRLFTIRKDMLAFVEITIDDDNRRHQGLKPRVRDRSTERITTGPTKAFPLHVTMSKNEETSSDYSSKSPSPSSVHQNGERMEHEPVPQRFHENTSVIDQSGIKDSASHNYFASPLSTTYLMQGFDRSASQLHQSYKNPNTTVPDVPPMAETQKNTLTTTPVKNQSHIEVHNNLTYNVSQRKQKPQDSTHVDAASHQRPAESAQSPRVPAGPVPNQTTVVRTNHDTPREPSPQSLHNEHPKQSPRVVAEQSQRRSQESQSKSANPQIQVVQASPQPETTTRRSLFPGQSQEEHEDVKPSNLTIEQGTYDSFFNLPGSNHSTPAKPSPDHNKDVMTPAKNDDGETEVSANLTMMSDNVSKKGEGFELLDDLTPNTAVAKKKEQFLLRQLKKEEELKRKKADRENLAEKKREEARQKQEEAAAKKAEDKIKKQKIFEEYKKRQKQQEDAQLLQQSNVIIAGSAKKQQPGTGARENHEQHSSRSVKPSRSGRASPAADATPTSSKHKHPVIVQSPPGAAASIGNHKTFNLSGGSGSSNITTKLNDAENLMTFNITEGSDHNGNVTKPVRTRKLSSSGKKDWDAGSASSSAVSSDYAGPKLYKQPSSKSNRTIIHNAISHCCLPGKVNESLRVKTIKVLEMSDARHFMVLFRDSQCQYRSLYSYDPDSERLHKISGNGPINIVPNMIERLYKYNSGRKAFSPLPSKTLSVGIDAITIKNSVWQTTKKHVPPKK